MHDKGWYGPADRVQPSEYEKAMDESASGVANQPRPYKNTNPDQTDGTPNMGTTAPAGKSTEPGPFKYRFGMSTSVKDVVCEEDAHCRAMKRQEDSNLSGHPHSMKMTSNDQYFDDEDER